MFRFIKYLFPLFLILIIVYAYFWMKGFEYRKTDPSIAVTESCLLFLETSGFQSLLTYVIEDNLMWNDLKNIPEISDTDSLLLHLSELLKNDPQIKGLSGGKIVVAINLIPPDNPVLVLIAQQTRMISDKNLVSALTSSGRMEVINRRKVAGTTVFDVASTAGSVVHNFSIALKKGLLICSFSADQVERTIYALEKEGRTEPVHNYRKLIMTMAENVPANIYIKFSMLDTLLTAFQSYPAGFASSGGYDIVPGTDFLSLNGFISFEDTMNQALEIIKDETPSVMTLHDFIPASAILLLQLHFNDISTFFRTFSMPRTRCAD